MAWLTTSGLRVLIVDDHPDFRRAARLLLVAGGYDVVGESDSAAAAYADAAALRPDVVLLDIALPDGSGLDVARRLVADDDPPVVVLISSRDGGGFRTAAAECGALGFLPKAGFSIASLRRLLRHG